jgi:hypothetical protein
VLKRIFPIIILLLLSCEVDKNNKPKPVESVSGLSSPIPISTPIATPSVTPIVIPSNLQPSPSPSWDCTFRTPDDLIGFESSSKVKKLSGIIEDRNNNPLTDATIDITSEITYDELYPPRYFKNVELPKQKCDTYYLKFQTKTDKNGKYNFTKTISTMLSLTVSKKGWSTRTFIGNANYLHCDGNIIFSNNDICGSGFFLLPQNEPEINNILLNDNKISFKLLSQEHKIKDFEENSNTVRKESLLMGFEETKLDKIAIELYFSESIKKETVENNIYIISAEEPSYILDKKDSNFSMSWSEDDTKLKLNFKLNKTGKYRLAFKDSFQDLESNQALDKKYFRVSSGDDRIVIFLQNIVFEYKN